ncbi:MAG: glycosyltransferase [Actinobacteria bacterium]|nr:glycosyltransferase [Actinomycetota bacterium]
MRGISVIIPTYNEAETVYHTVLETAEEMKKLIREYEIIVVNDGSTDNTADEAGRAARDLDSVKVVNLKDNRGKGNAMKRGFEASGMEYVCFIDADLELHPSQIGTLYTIMKNTGSDIVTGSKRHPQSELNYPVIRKIYSTVYYWIIYFMFKLPVRDTQTGIKLFRREVLEQVFPRITCKGYTLDLELLVVANYIGYRIAEAPIKLDFKRKYKRITWHDIRGIVVDTVAICYRLYAYGYYGSPIKTASSNEPKVSIIIPTRAIDPMVEECLERCAELNYSNYDIKLITDFPEERELPQPGSRIIASGPVGPATKRNMGVADSDAEIIAFIDSDAWPEYDWLRNSIAYLEDQEVAAVGGPGITPDNDSQRQQASGLIYTSMIVSGPTTYRYAYRAYREVDDYPTSNLIVKREDFNAVDGFDSQFWPGEDTVFCWKLTQVLKKKILYVPNVTVFHHRRKVYRGHLKQVNSYARHRGYFAKVFPETSRRPTYFVPSLFLIALIAGLILSFFNTGFLLFYATMASIYLIAVLGSSIKSLNLLINIMMFPGIIATHIVYGYGVIRGLTSKRMKEQ